MGAWKKEWKESVCDKILVSEENLPKEEKKKEKNDLDIITSEPSN